jgi:dTDP-4-dehydrorhamnose 3,5-epimerase
MTLDIQTFPVAGPALLTPVRMADERGWLCEAYSVRVWAALGLASDPFVQDNESFSPQAGTLRGIHFQRPPHNQGKLIRVLRGAAHHVGVDLRAGSPTYGAHVAARLDAETGAQLWTPPGFAHGLVTEEPDTLVQYKVTGFFAANHAFGVAWDDPDLAIAWPTTPTLISARDRAWPRLKEIAPLAV